MARDATDAAAAAAAAATPRRPGRLEALVGRWRASLQAAWRATWISRLVVWAAGVGAVAAFGVDAANATAYDPTGLTRPFGAVGDALVAPAARWDAVWFLRIAEDGYDAQRAAFFPLYPALVALAGAITGSALVGGISVSVACLVAGLAIVHRLVALDFGDDVARLAVLLVACFPGALWLSAVYSEALFLALSAGAVYAARTERWAVAGVLGGLAATTRSAGVVLLVPLGLLWWRARPRRATDAAWLALVPGGLALVGAVLAAAGEDPLAPLRAQEAWNREAAGPLGAVPDAVRAAWEGAGTILAGDPRPSVPFDPAWLDVGLLACLVLVVAAAVGALRRLPAAYALYAVAALALPLSFPADGQPLMSLPRFVAVLWPLHLWLAVVLARRGRGARLAVVGLFLLGLALVSAEVSTWGWVA